MKRYDLTADMYDERYSLEQAAKYQAALENTKLRGGAILDVGCGTGLFFRHVAFKAQTVVGVDISRQLLAKAAGQAKELGNVFLLQADADHLPFTECFFEVAFAFTLLQNMPEPSKTLLELERVVAHKGNVIVTGLKRVFPLDQFLEILELSDFVCSAFVNDEELKCYVAVLSRP